MDLLKVLFVCHQYHMPIIAHRQMNCLIIGPLLKLRFCFLPEMEKPHNNPSGNKWSYSLKQTKTTQLTLTLLLEVGRLMMVL